MDPDGTDIVPGEDEAQPVVDTSPPKTEAGEIDDAPGDERTNGIDGADGEDEEAQEVYEFDFGGEKLPVPVDQMPAELAEKIGKLTKDTFADYVRKTEDVATREKQANAREEAATKLANLHGESLATYARGLTVGSELERLRQVDIQSLWAKANAGDAQARDQARQLSDAISRKEAELNSIKSTLQHQEAASAAATEEEKARRAEEGKATVFKAVPGFEADLPKVLDYVVENSRGTITKEFAEKNWALNPVFATMAYKAMKMDEITARQQAPKPVTPPQAPVTAVARRGGRRNTATPSDKDSVDDWVKKRNAQIRKRRGRA